MNYSIKYDARGQGNSIFDFDDSFSRSSRSFDPMSHGQSPIGGFSTFCNPPDFPPLSRPFERASNLLPWYMVGGSNDSPTVNSATIDAIKRFEGFEASPAPDPIGLPTVGYGHLCKSRGCGEVQYSFPLTTTTASALLNSDLVEFQNCVSKSVSKSVQLNENQYGALVSWAYNVGCSNVAKSTLIKRLNNEEDPNTVIAEELPKWNKAGGKVLPGLDARRAAEVLLSKGLLSR